MLVKTMNECIKIIICLLEKKVVFFREMLHFTSSRSYYSVLLEQTINKNLSFLSIYQIGFITY